METKHTTGEWTYIKGENSKSLNPMVGIRKKSFFLIADISRKFPFNNEEAEANAKLIAAAPELLNALDNFIQVIDMCTSKQGRRFMEEERLSVYDTMKESLTYKTAVTAIKKATL